MRALLYLILFAVVVAGVVWGLQRIGELRRAPARTPIAGGDHAERASLAYGPDSGAGELRLTPSQLIFRSDAGRVLVIERLDLVGVAVSRDLPDRTLSAPVLVVTASGDAYYFAVAAPAEWAKRLLG